MLDVLKIREDFPILKRQIHGRPLVYLDNAATSQKPKAVIDALVRYYSEYNANIHRGIHTLAEEATAAYEEVRENVARFAGVRNPETIIFTRNTTESINLVAYAWGRKNIHEGDEIVLSQMEHHSNLVPWQILAKEKGAKLKFLHVTDEGTLSLEELFEILSSRTKLLTVTHMSNVLGTINPVEKMIQMAHEKGAVVLVDGAQSVPHMPVNIENTGADFYVFSSHKMLGPTGVGVLYGKKEILSEMDPFLGGGDMIKSVKLEYATYNDIPWKYEAGTPNVADVIAFGEAVTYLSSIGMENVRAHEKEITSYALSALRELGRVELYGPEDMRQKGGVIPFNLADIHPHDLGTALDYEGVAVRAGHHCAQPLMNRLGVVATTRVSFYIYNTVQEVNVFIDALIKAREFFGHTAQAAVSTKR